MQIINMDKEPNVTGDSDIDIIIIDEAQDMTLLYFKLINKFIKDVVKRVPQLVILGDRYQGVYEFMKADTRFLTLADQIWNIQFTHLTLKESYRVTKQMAWFINNVMLGNERIIAKKEGCTVHWHITNTFDLGDAFLHELVNNIKYGIYKPDDIFILSASLKGASSPTKKIENIFVEHDIPVFVPISEDGKLDEDVTRGKVVFSSLPSSKGRERSVVVLLGFDENYFNFYAKTSPKDICPATLYVAATRAKDRLIIVGDKKAAHMPFIKFNTKDPDFSKHVTLHSTKKLFGASKTGVFEKSERRTSVTELVKFLKQETIEFLTPIVESLFVCDKDPLDIIDIPCKVCTGKNMFEDVSDLNGLAIPTIWETSMHNTNTIYKLVVSGKKKDPFIMNASQIVKKSCTSVEDYLYMTNVYTGMTEGYHGRIAQIKSYDWLTDKMVNSCIKHLENNVSKDELEFESRVDIELQTRHGLVKIAGCVDIVNINTVWEVKCVDTLQLEHMIQLILYYWMFQRTNKYLNKDKTFKLINIRTGEIRQLIANTYNVENIIECLLDHKYATEERMDDPSFIHHVRAATLRLPPRTPV
jgi:hypothetical protein